MEGFSIIACGPESLDRYAQVPIRFTCDRTLQVVAIDDGLGGFCLEETQVEPTVEKDFDLHEHPTDWPEMFDLTKFRFWMTVERGLPVGCAALVWDTPSIHMLDGRSDLAVLWDLRVNPAYRGRGIGRALFSHAADFARSLGLSQMKVETQNNNVVANRFYHAMGCQLGAIHRFAYAATPEFKDEAMMLWYLTL